MEIPRLEEVRLTAFKSFVGQHLDLCDLTLVIGRNGSGKSNALDALVVLSRLAQGEPLRDAMDGPRADEEPIRGGAEGCAPLGQDTFSLGCRVRAGRVLLDLDVEIEVRPEVRIVSERLTAVERLGYGSKRKVTAGRALLASDPRDPRRSDLNVRYFNGRTGTDPGVPFSADRLLISQVPVRVPATSEATRLVHRAAEYVVTALREVFLLDPVPHLMRQYVNARDSGLRRNADNLSAAVAELKRTDRRAFGRLKELIAGMPEYPVVRIDSVRTPLGDVQLVLHEEGFHRRVNEVPARLLSDGMLRFLACGTALLTAPIADGETGPPDLETDAVPVAAQRLLVVEEIENGLYPTQAARVLDLMKEESRRRRIGILFTTHSPALLNSLSAEDHAGVVVCMRDPDTGESRLTRLVDLPGYVELFAAGDLGDAVIKDRLPAASKPRTEPGQSIEEFLGSL